MVYKRCHEGRTPCPDGVRFNAGKAATARCKHPWYLRVMEEGREATGPVKKFAFLLRPGEPLPDNKTDALELEGRVRTWLRTGENPAGERTAPPAPEPEPAAVMTIREAEAIYQVEHIAEMGDTGAMYLSKRIAKDCGDRPLTDLLDPNVIKDWLEDLGEDEPPRLDGDTRKDSTLNRYRARWSHLITFCRIKFDLTGPTPFYHPILNPASELRRLKEYGRTRRLFPGEEARLIRACRSLKDGGLMLGRLFCALDLGLRRREMLLVDLDHITKTPAGWSLRLPADNTKSGKPRTLPIESRRLLTFIKARQKALPRAFGADRGPRFVFGLLDGARLDSFRTEWEDVQCRAGVRAGEYVDGGKRWVWTHNDELTWHDLRHECGSRLAAGTSKTPPMPLRDIQEMLGHAKLEMTARYLQTSAESVRRNLRRVQRAQGV
jgi:integrase